MTRYVGNGSGDWRGDVFRYTPSVEDRLMAGDVAEAIAAKRTRNRRTGYGKPSEVRPAWLVTGFLGEVAAFHPLGSGPEVDVWEGSGWYGRADLGRLEVRTTSTWQLYGFAQSKYAKAPGLGGWRVTAKDAGRAVVCVEDRGDDLVVLGWAEANRIPRLAEPLGAIIAVVDYGDLHPLSELAIYAGALDAMKGLP